MILNNPTALTLEQNDQLDVIVDSLEIVQDATHFVGNLLKLSDEPDHHNHPFFSDSKIKNGLWSLLVSIEDDIGHLIDRLNELDVGALDKADGIYQAKLACRQVALLSSMLFDEKQYKHNASGIRRHSSYGLIFNAIYTRMRALCRHLKSYRENDSASVPSVDIENIAHTALYHIHAVLARWVPGEKREGEGYFPSHPKRADSKPNSFLVNMRTGVWDDFVTDDKGDDLVTLVAYIDGLSQQQAARELADFLAIESIGKGGGVEQR